jgi:endonuclease/exonuclease/phosphatase (EEP) superfamily protein YafD
MFFLVLLILAGPEVIIVKQISEFAMHIMFFFFGLAFLFMILGYDRLVLLSFGLTATLCVFLKNGPNEEFFTVRENFEEKISLAHINLSNIASKEKMIDALASSNIDVVSFQEYTPEWIELKDKIKTWFPYSKEALRIDPYGKIIFSKYPIHTFDTINRQVASDIKFEIVKNNHTFNIISTYLVPSINANSLAKAKKQLEQLNYEITKTPNSTIVLGEFNMVYWSNELKDFKEKSKLQNSRRDVIPVSLKVPYDHIYYSKDIQCVQMKDMIINRKERIGLISVFQLDKSKVKNITIY